MPDTTDISTLFDDLYALGERIYEALDRDDLDAFFEQVEAREDLVRRLDACARPPDAAARWKDRGEALLRQNRRLLSAISHHEERLRNALEALEQVRQARVRYVAGAPASPRILNKNLCG